ncbi:hypothetical protein COT65_01995 [Candidatus Shapirobacteria bacterium CG09_land_8_20_14_0_10_47_13]|uniref:PDZ domain-containing protein n=1 Tax=Candidatus Shapirobacteria bacterium CG09_land_8_20_14_0_10_47_13 TaxID=1974481 RepID=A0A2H0WMG7_9BACT|nr:MAG: hypothetical protein COT65_01995 [Candidatus Shapirobacteria bacterium CG09_land_8_20_14_0_10_47_13]
MIRIKRFIIGVAVGIVVIVSILGGAISDRLFGYRILDKFFPNQGSGAGITQQKVVTEESVVIDVVEKSSSSVVTVGITKAQPVANNFQWDPFGFFNRAELGKPEPVSQDIGSGFIVDKDGLIVTNKHVVADTSAKYRVITKDDKEYEVQKIYRDPTNDLAVLQISPDTTLVLKPVALGDSGNLKVGQFVIAIGTALGEFRQTVTTGVISGLGRGITAGSVFEGSVERLDNVIQTDAAINPGNSGGPLFNSAGQVIGINVAVAQGGQNVGFAIPINVIKDALDNFNQTGKFERAYLGVRYRLISQDLALMNEVPQGAYVVEVVVGSPAERAGVKIGDIITKFDGQAVKEADGGLAKFIGSKKIGDKVRLTIWRDGKESDVETTLQQSSE